MGGETYARRYTVAGSVEFDVPGKVVGSARPRVTKRGTYIPKATRDYRKSVLAAFLGAGGRRLEGPLSVRITVRRALPKSRPKKVESEPDTFKPDVDNIAKNVLDALNGHAWDDDSQVVELSVRKMPRTRRDEGITVEITRL